MVLLLVYRHRSAQMRRYGLWMLLPALLLSAAALLAAVSPLFYVPDTFTVCGGLICVLLALELAFSLLPERKAD